VSGHRPWRQVRGQQTARLVAEYLQPIAPGATATPSAYAGNDIQGIDWDVEVKAPRGKSFKHVKAGAGHVPVPPPAAVSNPVHCVTCGGQITPVSFSPRAALQQACRRRKPEHVLPPMVVLRPDGTGDASVGEFVVMRRFEDDRAILEELLRLRAWHKEAHGECQGP
jgi:hypothetical protein